jgi:glc operon protein GlcG
MLTKYLLSSSEAQTIVTAAQAHAHHHGWARLDNAAPSSVNTAIEKARSAATTGLPTKALEAMIRERPGVATLGRVAVEGGLPILYKGQRVGGVGVSGVKSDQDAAVAQAGLEALDLNS